jgi:hypothetical protein
MFGSILVFTVAVALVATYIFIVNRLLRSDEHWNEAGHVRVPLTNGVPAIVTAPDHRPAFLVAKHV